MRKRITTRLVERLQPPEVGSQIVWDGQVPGFGARVTGRGVKAFVLQYTLHGRERSSTIGRYPEWSVEDAREKALVWRRAISEGHDPLEERRAAREELTFRELAKEYLGHPQTYKRASSQRNERYLLSGILLPRLGTFQVKAIGRRDVEALHASLQATPYQANRVLALLSYMFNKAIDWGWVTMNPVKGTQRYHEDKREVWLDAEQLQRLDQAFDDYADQRAANALRLLVLTGSRKSEVLSADWTMFDLVRGVWTKPSHHTKQRKVEHVPLSQAALRLLKKMKPRKEGPLFPGRRKGKTRVSLRRPWAQVCKAAGLTKSVAVQGKRRTITRHQPTLRMHDLRHTFASHLVSDGVGLQVVGRLLGHTNPQTTNRYAHVADEALRAATNRFEEIVQAPTRKVSRK
jgi:integrase